MCIQLNFTTRFAGRSRGSGRSCNARRTRNDLESVGEGITPPPSGEFQGADNHFRLHCSQKAVFRPDEDILPAGYGHLQH